ncbi:MAG: hypothetical protein AAF928_16110, partial [Myxococcota bacterium]
MPIPASLRERVVAGALVASSPEVVVKFEDRDSARYLSVLEVFSSKKKILLSWKTGDFPNCVGPKQAVRVATDCDARLRRPLSSSDSSCLRNHRGSTVIPSDPRNPSVPHNLALAVSGTLLWGVGGETTIGRRHEDLAKGAAGDAESWATTHGRKTYLHHEALVLRSNVSSLGRFECVFVRGGVWAKSPGCVERRAKYREVCQFDGRFSIAATTETWLYARANTHTQKNGRFVS